VIPIVVVFDHIPGVVGLGISKSVLVFNEAIYKLALDDFFFLLEVQLSSG
jgi:hypothetical protein